ncbi:MAG: GntR family transcriptional regulator, partial [Abditibacteriota bacterium]|nr:GntR family transcriptional regulator [Abditibacteriota bacterium]
MEKYIQLENKLKEFIEHSEPHTPLPSLSKIMKTYDVSTTTARKALSDLCNEGVIYTVNGKGSFVAPYFKEFPEVYCVFQGIMYKNYIEEGTGLFPFLLEDLCTSISENKMEMILSVYKDSLDLERQILQRLPEKKPYGVIIYATGRKELFPYYKKVVEMIPNTVFVDRYISGIKSNYVGTDNYNASKEMTQKILSSDFDKIYYVDTENPRSNVADERKKGFVDIIGNTDKEKLSVVIENDSDDYEDFMKKLFAY